MLERISSRVGAQDQHAAGSDVCVWVWKRVATSREIVPGHSVWMKVIASGGWPAADTQCASAWMCMEFRAADMCPFTTLTVHLYVHLCSFFCHYAFYGILFLYVSPEMLFW